MAKMKTGFLSVCTEVLAGIVLERDIVGFFLPKKLAETSCLANPANASHCRLQAAASALKEDRDGHDVHLPAQLARPNAWKAWHPQEFRTAP